MKILNASFFVMLDNSCLIIFIITLSSKQFIRYILVKIVPCLQLLRCLQLLIFWKILIPMLNRVPTLIRNSIVHTYLIDPNCKVVHYLTSKIESELSKYPIFDKLLQYMSQIWDLNNQVGFIRVQNCTFS